MDVDSIKDNLTKASRGENPIIMTEEQLEILESLVISYMMLAENPEGLPPEMVQEALQNLDGVFNRFAIVVEQDKAKVH